MPTIREITVGETLSVDMLPAGPPCTTRNQWPVPWDYYAFTPSADGTLTATVTWHPVATDAILLLRIEDSVFEPVAAPWSPVVGQLSVRAGHPYALQVGLAGHGGLSAHIPYVLTTAFK